MKPNPIDAKNTICENDIFILVVLSLINNGRNIQIPVNANTIPKRTTRINTASKLKFKILLDF